MLRTFLLASVAILATSASRGSDLPTVEPADQYMRVCGAFGEKFWYIPGSDTCLEIGGYVRAETHYVDGDVATLRGGSQSDFNNWTTQTRGTLQFDARTNTSLGLIKTYIEMELNVGPDDFAAQYEGDPDLRAAFVEVSSDRGTFTAGHTGSFFDFYGSDDYGTRVDIDDNTTEQSLFAYTVSGPSNLRGTLSVEDPASSGRLLDGAGTHGGQELPDLVGTLRLEKDWGSAQVMGVVRRNHDTAGDHALGFAVGGGFSATIPKIDVVFSTQVGYSDGALGYITTDPGGLGDFGGSPSDSTTAWNVRAGVTRSLSEHISGWLDGSFTRADDDFNDDSYDYWAVAVGAEYAPNDAIAMGPEFAYNKIDGDDPGEDGNVWGLMWRFQSNF